VKSGLIHYILMHNIMIKKTFTQLKEIDEIYGRLLSIEGFEQTKLAYAFKRFSKKNISEIFTDFNSVLQDLRIDNALTDKDTGAILYQANGEYKYSPEGLKNVLKKSREITKEWNDKEFEIESFICKEIPPLVELTEEEMELLEGAIINYKK
jgi:hypothetical protein